MTVSACSTELVSISLNETAALLIYTSRGAARFIRSDSYEGEEAEDKDYKLLLTRMSSPPNLRFSQAAKVTIDEGSATSKWQNATRSPWPSRDSTAAFPLPTSLEVSTTVSPSSANLLTSANPMPLLAPVTTATVSFDHHLHSTRHRNDARYKQTFTIRKGPPMKLHLVGERQIAEPLRSISMVAVKTSLDDGTAREMRRGRRRRRTAYIGRAQAEPVNTIARWEVEHHYHTERTITTESPRILLASDMALRSIGHREDKSPEKLLQGGSTVPSSTTTALK
ncbi:hypothetical protein BHE74_00010596 [Ensete ventricosum]|nr:hypothetical protein BHE74_00010596 [Ensete ventricosum]RZS24457.1 hypothetical protein BHM03_00057526 [Ensete ventricosum]